MSFLLVWRGSRAGDEIGPPSCSFWMKEKENAVEGL